MEELVKNKDGIQILTDSGWSDFSGLMIMGERDTVLVLLADGSEIQCTPEHKIYTEGMIPVQAQHLKQNHKVVTGDTVSNVVSVESSPAEMVYDIHKVNNNRRFIANNMLVSNCEFVIYDETLINSLKLVEIKGIDPVFSQGQVRWYKKPNANGMYILALDPCAGTGGDYSAIQVIDATTLEQVAEWQHNKTPVEGQVKMLMNIMRYIQSCGAEQIYWSVENNGVGEAALVVIRDTGEENFPGDFLTEPKSSSGKARRKGFSTTKRTKNEACIQLKRLVETDKIKLNSKKTISELKNFISYADTYRAKQGQHDDLVMSLILVIRMINFISQYEDAVYDNINSGLKYDGYLDDDFDTPMPIGFL